MKKLTFLAVLTLTGCAGDEPAPPSRASAPSGEVRLYVADRYEGVRQLNPDTLEVVTTIDTGRRPHGLIVSPDGRTLYITVETSNELLRVDVATHEITGRAAVGPVPNEPTISRDGRYVYVPQRGGDQCDIVDVDRMEVIKTLPVGKEEHNAYTSADGRHVYVTSMGENLIAVIDTASQEIVRKIPAGGVPRPLALTRDESLAYVALSGLNGFVVIDLAGDRVIDRIEIPYPPGTPAPLLDTYTHGLLLTPDERELWVASYATDKVWGYALPEKEPIAELVVGGGPHWFTLHPDGEPLYVSLERAGAVAAIHRGIRTVLRSAAVGQAPTRILAFRVGPGPKSSRP